MKLDRAFSYLDTYKINDSIALLDGCDKFVICIEQILILIIYYFY